MAYRKLVAAVVWALAGAVPLGVPSPPVVADNHASMRMYKLNSKGQLNRVRWLKNVGEAGCHGGDRAREVSKFAQIGFLYCTLYADPDCREGSELTAMWDGEDYKRAEIDVSQPQVRLLRGTEWVLDPNENVELKSWYCEYE